MVTRTFTYKLLTVCIALVWLVNGLFCKVLNMVPRHQDIVGRILDEEHSRLLIVLIGLSEIVMFVWVLSRYLPRLNALVQIALVASMNIMEFLLVPDLLLWGRFNAVFALLFIVVVYCHEFVLRPQTSPESSP